MDDLKLILYLLVGLGWLIMRNYRKVQQQRPRMVAEEAPAAPPQESATDAYKRMRNRPEEAGRSRAAGETALPETPASVSDYAFGKVDEEGRRVTEYFDRIRKSALQDALAADERSDATYPENGPPFDVKRAVLYSEILKRPEW